MKSSIIPQKLYHLSTVEFPTFYISLENWFEIDGRITGSICSTLELSDGDKALLINDLFKPFISALAKVYRESTDINGINYRFSFSLTDIGVPFLIS